MKVPTKSEAPDGGWGILICIGMAMPFISGLAALPSFGLVFGDFLKSIDAETSVISFIISAFFCAFSFAGLFSGPLFKRFGLRTVGLFGGTLYFIGSFAQIFVTSAFQLLLAFSLIQGCGFGLIVPTSYTTFNNYFVRKRVLWMSVAQSLIGLGTMFYPVAMQKFLELYGFRGCLAILAAINAHAILGMLLMQPVEWHMRKVLLTEQELEKMPIALPVSPDALTGTGNVTEPLENSIASNCDDNDEEHEVENRLTETTPVNIVREQHSDKALSFTHLTIWQRIVNFLDLTLLKQPIYVNLVLGVSFALYSDITFFALQPLYMFELGFTKPDTANIIAIGAAADLASRIFLAFLALCIQVPSRYIYLAGSFFTVICRFMFLNVFDFMGMASVTAILGFLRTWIHVPLPLVFAEYLPKERYATGYGLFMFLQGNIMFAIGPAVGYLRDKFQDYILTFHCLNFFMALCAVPWLIEICILRYYRKNKVETEAL